MQKFIDDVTDLAGNAIVGATVTVTIASSGALATLYADSAGTTPIANPITTSATGGFEFHAANGRYNIAVSKIGMPTQNANGILLYDPANGDDSGLGSRVTSVELAVNSLTTTVNSHTATVNAAEDKIDVLATADGANRVWTSYGVSAQDVFDTLQSTALNVSLLGAKGDGVTDDYPVFANAINLLPALGGTIRVPAGTYSLSATPNWGTKSVYWDISPAALFVGAGTGQNKFPSMKTNGAQIAVGPFIQNQSRVPYTLSNGGVAGFQVEMIQPADVVGQSVALYLGAQGSNPNTSANVWAGNFLVKADTGAGGTYQGIEVDVDVFSDAALVKGISVNGIGTANPDVGIELIRSDATKWNVGIDIMNAVVGVQIRNTTGLQMGISVGGPTAQLSSAVTAKLLSNGGDGVVVQRFTDTAPTGSALRVVDAANTKNLVNIDTIGNALVQSVQLSSGAIAGLAGQFALGNTTAAVATAGSLTLPANPALYWSILVGSTIYKIPMYNN